MCGWERFLGSFTSKNGDSKRLYTSQASRLLFSEKSKLLEKHLVGASCSLREDIEAYQEMLTSLYLTFGSDAIIQLSTLSAASMGI